MVAQNARTIFTTTESKEKKIKAITKALSWLVRQDDAHCVVMKTSKHAPQDSEGLAMATSRMSSDLSTVQCHPS